MIRKTEWKWERLDEQTERAKVMGGWLVRLANSKFTALACEFIEDPNHEWIILPPKTVLPSNNVTEIPDILRRKVDIKM